MSVIVPTHTLGGTLPRCLAALLESDDEETEIIVVHDGATEVIGESLREGVSELLRLPQRLGPAGARNEGAKKARGEVLLFIDSDVLVRPDTIARVASVMRNDPALDAVFGSYDDAPAHPNFLSQYKNLHHHFIHQTSDTVAETFWAGCGAIRRPVFELTGGFDARRYPTPSIEDIELGYRLRARGGQIRLDKSIQVKHLKCWRISSLLRADIFARALPWSQLILHRPQRSTELNLKWRHRASSLLVGALACAAMLSPLFPNLIWALISLLILVILLNLDWYFFLFRKKGAVFVIKALPMHWLYYFYSGVCFAVCWLMISWRRTLSR